MANNKIILLFAFISVLLVIAPVMGYSSSLRGPLGTGDAYANPQYWYAPGETVTITLASGGTIDVGGAPPSVFAVNGYWVMVNTRQNSYYYVVNTYGGNQSAQTFTFTLPTNVVVNEAWWGYGFLGNNGNCEMNVNHGGYFAIKSGGINHTAPVTSFTESATGGITGQTINLTSTTPLTPPAIITQAWSITKPNGTVYSPGSAITATFIPDIPGTYMVNLTASNAFGSNTATKYYTFVQQGPPAASFTATPLSGSSPLNVQFTDSSTGSPTSWSWSFGDGGTSTIQNPSHTYTSAGNYTVSLTSANANGSNATVRAGYVVVMAPVTWTYSMTNVELYYPDTLLDLAYPHFNPNYTPGRAIIANLSGRLQNDGWQSAFIHHDSDVTKTDFGTNGGGLNNAVFHYHFGHGNATHALDLSGYVSHCCDGPVCFDPTDSIHPSEIQWNGNMKWIILDACSALENQDWAQPMGTTHGVLGFASEKMPSQDLPNLFLHYTIDDNNTVYQSYHDATYFSFTRNVTAAAIFSNYDQQQTDHFPGHGPLNSDEFPNNHATDVYITWSCGGGPIEDKPYN